MNTDEYKLFLSDCKDILKEKKNVRISFDDTDTIHNVFLNYNKARKKAANIRQKYINNIEENLISFEKKFIECSGIVNWAVDYNVLLDDITKLLKDRKINKLNVFESSFINELGIIKTLKQDDFKVISEDNKCVIFEPKYAVTKTGSLYLMFNSAIEMQIVMNSELKIFILQFNNLVRNIDEIELLSHLYSVKKENQDYPFLSALYTPNKDTNKNTHLFIVDNGRSNLLELKEHRKTLSCIDCDACKKVCPVYSLTGSVPYRNVFSGPIANVTLPFLETIDTCKHLSYNCILCGNCTKVCPMCIPITDLIISNRNYFYENKYIDFIDRYKIKILKNNLISRKKLNRKAWLKQFLFNLYFTRKYKQSRKFKPFAKYTFEQIKSGNAKNK